MSWDPLAHQQPGYWCCWWRARFLNATQNSWASTFACSSRCPCDRRKDWCCETFQLFQPIKGSLEPRASDHYSTERASSCSEHDTSVSLDLARQQFLFSVLQVLKATRGERQLFFPFSNTQVAQKMEDALKQLRCHRLNITPYALQHGGATEDRAVNAEARKRCRSAEDGSALPVYDGTKNTRPALERDLEGDSLVASMLQGTAVFVPDC